MQVGSKESVRGPSSGLAKDDAYLRKTNHRLSQVFSFASTMTMRCPFLVGPSLQISVRCVGSHQTLAL